MDTLFQELQHPELGRLRRQMTGVHLRFWERICPSLVDWSISFRVVVGFPEDQFERCKEVKRDHKLFVWTDDSGTITPAQIVAWQRMNDLSTNELPERLSVAMYQAAGHALNMLIEDSPSLVAAVNEVRQEKAFPTGEFVQIETSVTDIYACDEAFVLLGFSWGWHQNSGWDVLLHRGDVLEVSSISIPREKVELHAKKLQRIHEPTSSIGRENPLHDF